MEIHDTIILGLFQVKTFLHPFTFLYLLPLPNPTTTLKQALRWAHTGFRVPFLRLILIYFPFIPLKLKSDISV